MVRALRGRRKKKGEGGREEGKGGKSGVPALVGASRFRFWTPLTEVSLLEKLPPPEDAWTQRSEGRGHGDSADRGPIFQLWAGGGCLSHWVNSRLGNLKDMLFSGSRNVRPGTRADQFFHESEKTKN